MAARSKEKQQPARPALAKGGAIAILISALTATGILWPRLLTVADIQTASAAAEIHAKHKQRIEQGLSNLRDRMDSQHQATTDRLDRILEAVIKR